MYITHLWCWIKLLVIHSDRCGHLFSSQMFPAFSSSLGRWWWGVGGGAEGERGGSGGGGGMGAAVRLHWIQSGTYWSLGTVFTPARCVPAHQCYWFKTPNTRLHSQVHSVRDTHHRERRTIGESTWQTLRSRTLIANSLLQQHFTSIHDQK